METSRFDRLPDVYEALVNWPRRLDHETLFYRRLFASVDAANVLDVACGTGHHAALFHGWGLEVEGSDVSPNMIDRARANFGESTGLRWIVRSFDTPIESRSPWDVAICVGNSLALAPDPSTVRQAIGQMLRAVRAGGAVAVHVLNLWRLPEGPTLWQKCQKVELSDAAHLVVKGVHRCGDHGYVDLIVANLAGEISYRSESVRFLGLEADDLARIARASGAEDIALFGGYQNEPYQRQTSTDLIMVARKRPDPDTAT